MTGIGFDNETQNRYTYEQGTQAHRAFLARTAREMENRQVCRLTDNLLQRVVTSEYDSCDRPMRVTHTEQGTHLYTGEVNYDSHINLSLFKEQTGGARKKTMPPPSPTMRKTSPSPSPIAPKELPWVAWATAMTPLPA